MDGEEEIIPQTLLQKLLFYTTAFFILLGTFSLFAFLFLVPFVIDPAFTTIFMQFDTKPVWCVTVSSEQRMGASNCTWSSCREGCTKELFKCRHLLVNYRLTFPPGWGGGEEANSTENWVGSVAGVDTSTAPSTPRSRRAHLAPEVSVPLPGNGTAASVLPPPAASASGPAPSAASAAAAAPTALSRPARALRDYDYIEELRKEGDPDPEDQSALLEVALDEPQNSSEWFMTGAKLYPNVKGCGYPPMLVCEEFFNLYGNVGSNFSCYYSKVDPKIVISELDMHQVYMNLVFAMAIPIPSFIVSVIYLTFAYFVIYNEEEDREGLVGTDAGDGEGADGEKGASSPLPKELTASGALTPGSEAFREDLASFGHQLKVAMADEMSRESVGTAASNATPESSPPVPAPASTPGAEGVTLSYLQPGFLPPSRGKKILPPIA